VVEPLRERWTAVQGAVLQLTETEGKKPAQLKKDREAAVKELLGYHAWLRGLRFLDPACGSGNFLYVTMAAVKRIELEVISELERVRGREQMEQVLDNREANTVVSLGVPGWSPRESHPSGARSYGEPVLGGTWRGTPECVA